MKLLHGYSRTEKQKGLRSSSVGSMEVLEDHNRDSFLVVPGASNVSNCKLFRFITLIHCKVVEHVHVLKHYCYVLSLYC